MTTTLQVLTESFSFDPEAKNLCRVSNITQIFSSYALIYIPGEKWGGDPRKAEEMTPTEYFPIIGITVGEEARGLLF